LVPVSLRLPSLLGGDFLKHPLDVLMSIRGPGQLLFDMLRLKTRDGIPFSEQIRRALDGFLVEKGIRKKPPKDRPVTVGRARIERLL
jgi:hypothetical protein